MRREIAPLMLLFLLDGMHTKTGSLGFWSDTMKNEKGRSHTVNYMWNQMNITIKVE
jgi:hypothetical protein